MTTKAWDELTLHVTHTPTQEGRWSHGPAWTISVQATLPVSEAIRAALAPRVSDWGGCTFVDLEAQTSTWHEVAFETLQQVAYALAPLIVVGIPDLQGVSDTSDSGSATRVTGVLGSRPFHFEVHQQSSGFRGAHAPAFVVFCQVLVHAARQRLEDDRFRSLFLAR